MYSHQKNFIKAYDWTVKLRDRYLHTIATFRIYEHLRNKIAINISGKEKAEANAKLFSRHLHFFAPVQESCRCYFFIELAKFFDNNPREQSLTLELLLDFVDSNLVSFSTDEFLKYHNKRYFIPDLLKNYKPISRENILSIKKRLQKNKPIISNLKTYRDKYLVHADINKVTVNITNSEIKILLKIIKDTIDLFYRVLDFAVTIYDNYDKEPVFAVDRVVNILQEYESERLNKIFEKYN